MNKKTDSARLILLLIGLIALLTTNLAAQNKAAVSVKQPADRILQNYIDVSSLPKDERKKFFSNLSAEEKANLFKLHLALQFVKRANLTADQKDIILEGISLAAPDAYDKNNSEKIEKSRQNAEVLGQKAKDLFSKQDFFEIFADLGGGAADINLLRKYLDISVLPTSKRKEELERVSANDKSNLWKFHIALQLVKMSGLNNRQTKIMLEVLAFAAPELYEIPKGSSEWKVKVNEPIQLFTKRAVEVFSQNEVTEIFSNLGGKTKDNSPDYDENIPTGCNCSRQWADCRSYETCGGLCSVPPGGGECGFLGMYVCDGKCIPI